MSKRIRASARPSLSARVARAVRGRVRRAARRARRSDAGPTLSTSLGAAAREWRRCSRLPDERSSPAICTGLRRQWSSIFGWSAHQRGVDRPDALQSIAATRCLPECWPAGTLRLSSCSGDRRHRCAFVVRESVGRSRTSARWNVASGPSRCWSPPCRPMSPPSSLAVDSLWLRLSSRPAFSLYLAMPVPDVLDAFCHARMSAPVGTSCDSSSALTAVSLDPLDVAEPPVQRTSRHVGAVSRSRSQALGPPLLSGA